MLNQTVAIGRALMWLKAVEETVNEGNEGKNNDDSLKGEMKEMKSR